MFATSSQSPKLTSVEYFAWEEQQLCRHEYINGEVYAMSGGTQNHSRISLKVAALLDNHLSSGSCRAFNSDCRVNLVGSNDYTYPDASVSCDLRDKTSEQYITYPCLIVEVLSDSTEAYDFPSETLRERGNKFFRYRQNPQLQDYVLVSSQEIAIDLYRKSKTGRWEIINYRSGDIVELQSINLSFPIEQAYLGIDFVEVTASEVTVLETTIDPTTNRAD
jgi:Uma2 family endonuclease